MNTDEIVSFIVNEVAPLYDVIPEKERKIYHALLQSLPSEILSDVAETLSHQDRTPWDLLSFIEWWQKKIGRNEPIETLLAWYQDKSSKRVRYAFSQLTKRFNTFFYATQIEVLRVFLTGGKTSSDWAAKRLYKQWISELKADVITAWETYKSPTVAKTIIHNCPKDIISQEDNPNIDVLDWFIAVGKLGLLEKVQQMDVKANQYIRELNCDEFIFYEDPSQNSLLYCLGMSPIIWAMNRLHYTDGIVRLAKLEQQAMTLAGLYNVKQQGLAPAARILKSLVQKEGYY